jgi:HlyD family secretion protein
MNNAGTVLMTIADLSVIQAKLDVDETDIVDVRLGQPARVAIDAVPDREFRGQVTKIGSSASQQTGVGAAAAAADQRGVTFEVEVTLQDEVPGVRPDFSCTANITTAVREKAIAVPIQALTVRDVDGTTEVEGVFVLRDGRVAFTPITVGIAGERYFEVLSGLAEADVVVTGPYASVRELQDGDEVTIAETDRDARS